VAGAAALELALVAGAVEVLELVLELQPAAARVAAAMATNPAKPARL
jgi:hypothetical protein